MRLPTLVACILFTAVVTTAADDIDSNHLQCLVCRSTIEEVENVLSKIDPKQDIEIGNYRLDAKGNVIRKKHEDKRHERTQLEEYLRHVPCVSQVLDPTAAISACLSIWVPLARSEVHISDVLDGICEKMSDYVRATYKSNGRLTILNLVTPSGGMNPEMSKVDIIQDGDLNKSLKFYCEEIIEEHEEPIIQLFRKGERDVINKVCTEATNICDELMPSDDDDDASVEEDDFMDRTEL